ncbi:MAG: hypothetical protein KGQ58_05910 [Proteobacteria bacterium]|nr:hypothetical protein [Pseudomonadota bacterium]
MKQLILVILLSLGIITSAQACHMKPFSQLVALHSKLALNPDQESQWKLLQTSMRQFHIKMRKDHKIIYHALREELKKNQPDFNRIMALKDSTRAQLQPARDQVEKNALAFYDNLNPHQKILIRDAIRNRMAEWRHHHCKMQMH